MEKNLIFCCELTDSSPSPETAIEFLSIFDYEFGSFVDVEKNITKHVIYFNEHQLAKSAAKQLTAIPEEWQCTGLKFTDITTFSIEKKDWSEVWKKHFKIQHITDHLTIKPSWLQYEQQKNNEIIIELDPGMSFGTGRHATSRFCMKMLEKIPDKSKKTLLDAGCGSGILSIAAYKMGFESISAFDYDYNCINCTRENFLKNQINPDIITIKHADIAHIDQQNNPFQTYDVVIINILSHILFANKQTILSFLQPGSYLILAGILTEEYGKISNAFTQSGLHEIEALSEDEWTGGMFRLK